MQFIVNERWGKNDKISFDCCIAWCCHWFSLRCSCKYCNGGDLMIIQIYVTILVLMIATSLFIDNIETILVGICLWALIGILYLIWGVY